MKKETIKITVWRVSCPSFLKKGCGGGLRKGWAKADRTVFTTDYEFIRPDEAFNAAVNTLKDHYRSLTFQDTYHPDNDGNYCVAVYHAFNKAGKEVMLEFGFERKKEVTFEDMIRSVVYDC